MDPFSTSTSTKPGLDQTSTPMLGPSWYQVAAKTWCNSNSSHGESLQDHLSLIFQEASFWTSPTSRSIEAREPSFINPNIQNMLELQITKRVELRGKGKEISDHALGRQDRMLQSWSSRQATTTSHPFWSRDCKSEQFSGYQQLFCQKVSGDHSQMKYSQLFWGLPFLHSESLVATINMARSLQDVPSIFFNVFSTYIPLEAQTNLPPQLFSPKPVLHHSIKSQTFTSKMSSTGAPPVATTQNQARDLYSLPNLPHHYPIIKDYGVSSATSSRNQFIVPLAVQHLELHLLKKHRESRSELPSIVKRSQESCNLLTSDTWVSKGHGSVDHLPEEFIKPSFRELLEQHLKKSFIQHQGKWSCKVQRQLDLMKCQESLPGMSQAEVHHGTPCPSSLADEGSQHPQNVPPKDPETFHPWRDPGKCLTNFLGRAGKDLHRRPEGPLDKVPQETSETEEETYHMRPPRRDAPSVSPVDRGKEQLAGILKNYQSSKCRHTKVREVPVAICEGVSIDHALAPPDNSNTNMRSWEKSPLNDVTICKNTNGPSFLDASTQKVLETHLTRRLVKHRWSLSLRGLKTIHVFNANKASALPSDVSLSSWDSREAGTDKTASDLGEPFQKAPEEKVMKIPNTVESLSTQIPPSALQLELLRKPLLSDNKSAQEGNLTSISSPQSLVGRAWHRDRVHGHWTDKPESTPGPVKSVHESQESGDASFREMCEGVLVREISVTSQSPSGVDIRHLEEAEEEESSDWALTRKVGEMAKSPTHSESWEASESPSPSTPISQGPEDSGLSTPHCLAPGVVLQDCATGTFLQDCAPEVLLAADILASRASRASRASKSRFKTQSPPSPSTSQDRHRFFPREESLTKITELQEPWTTHIFGPNNKKDNGSPRQDIQHSGTIPVKGYLSNNHEKKFGEKIKNFIVSILNPKDKGQENLPQKVKVLSGTTQNRGSGLSRLFMPHQVTEAQDRMTSAGWTPEQKPGVHHRCAPSKKNAQQNPPEAPVSRHVCRHRIPTAQSKTAQGNTACVHQANPKVHSQPSTNGMPCANKWAQVSTEPVSRASYYQHRAQAPLVPGAPIHCPRHCRCRSVLSGNVSAFPYWK
ncbi:spermatogenesis-associated protein 31E1-like [Mesocricetus auratus]|uniref:Spermatogenesis-associated protein 31E1-like n=1 Tax=Mesocricetus auratus TaxID=10036 RepID=A0ABM2Y8K6_MESAU|nr:spermatogenesis-associated protein 31E1-like [Mesocricetus auratus]